MRRGHFEAFRPICPLCARLGRDAAALVPAVVSDSPGDEIVSGILHCSNPACQHEYPILDGMPIIVPDLQRLLTEHGVEILLRDDLDPMLESLAGDALGADSWFAAVRHTLSTYGWDAYADLDPDEETHADGSVPGAAARCLDRLLALAGPAKPERVIDLGCAAGRTSFRLAERHPGALVLGLDVNLGLLRLARQAAAGSVSYPRRRVGLVYDRRRFPVDLPSSDRVDFWACDALALPFAAGSADLAVALNLLDCVTAPRQLLAALADLVRPRGRLLLATPYDWSTRATPTEAWIGGHSQRAAHGGGAETFLRELLTAGAHPQSVPGLTLLGEEESWPWQTRLHARSVLHYRTHLVALGKSDA
jgi:SAM-dependent methyltransferase/uncharacterized protein YbaR (Trm112 family)